MPTTNIWSIDGAKQSLNTDTVIYDVPGERDVEGVVPGRPGDAAGRRGRPQR